MGSECALIPTLCSENIHETQTLIPNVSFTLPLPTMVMVPQRLTSAILMLALFAPSVFATFEKCDSCLQRSDDVHVTTPENWRNKVKRREDWPDMRENLENWPKDETMYCVFYCKLNRRVVTRHQLSDCNPFRQKVIQVCRECLTNGPRSFRWRLHPDDKPSGLLTMKEMRSKFSVNGTSQGTRAVPLIGDYPGECSGKCGRQWCYNYKGKCSECEAPWNNFPYQLDWMDKDSFFSTYERKQCKHCGEFQGDSAARGKCEKHEWVLVEKRRRLTGLTNQTLIDRLIRASSGRGSPPRRKACRSPPRSAARIPGCHSSAGSCRDACGPEL